MRVLAAAVTALLVTTPAFAASPKVDAAIKVFQSTLADANRLKTFCQIVQVEEKIGEKEDTALDTQVDKLLDQMGSQFKAAWESVEDVDEASPDGVALAAALDQLSDKCPG